MGVFEASTRTPLRIGLTGVLLLVSLLLALAGYGAVGTALVFGYGWMLGRSDRRTATSRSR